MSAFRRTAVGGTASEPTGDGSVLDDEVVLLPGKTAPPHLSQALVPRPRLTAMLSHSVHSAPVTLLSGPAGSGKTVVTASWLGARPVSSPGAWLTLDENDDDPATFWTYLVESLAQAGVDVGGIPRLVVGAPLPRSLIPRLAGQLLEIGRAHV